MNPRGHLLILDARAVSAVPVYGLCEEPVGDQTLIMWQGEPPTDRQLVKCKEYE